MTYRANLPGSRRLPTLRNRRRFKPDPADKPVLGSRTGLLPQYFPNSPQHDLDEAAFSLNTRPRQTLGGMTPSEKPRRSVAMTP